jgi:hypothetical protein
VRRVLNALDNVLLAVVVVAGAWWGADRYVLDGPVPDEPPAVVEAGTADELEGIPVKGRAPRTGYDRQRFAVGAIDFDRNGCDHRNDTLARDLTDVVFRPGTNDCVVVGGTLADPYTGRTIEFVRGDSTSGAIEIDHVVALSDAWQKGAQQWDADTLARFGNDPRNLLAVDRGANRQKGDGDAATWLPPNKAFRCEYVRRQVEVKHAYGLWMTRAEHDAIAGVLAACPTAAA